MSPRRRVNRGEYKHEVVPGSQRYQPPSTWSYDKHTYKKKTNTYNHKTRINLSEPFGINNFQQEPIN